METSDVEGVASPAPLQNFTGSEDDTPPARHGVPGQNRILDPDLTPKPLRIFKCLPAGTSSPPSESPPSTPVSQRSKSGRYKTIIAARVPRRDSSAIGSSNSSRKLASDLTQGQNGSIPSRLSTSSASSVPYPTPSGRSLLVRKQRRSGRNPPSSIMVVGLIDEILDIVSDSSRSNTGIVDGSKHSSEEVCVWSTSNDM